MDSKKMFLEGGNSGHEFVPGKSSESLIIKRLLGQGIRSACRWIHPPLYEHSGEIIASVDRCQARRGRTISRTIRRRKEQHWAFIQAVSTEAARGADKSWPKNGIDHFVLARLEKEGLKPSPEADRVTLIRRVSLDLTGLPPTPQKSIAFVKDKRDGRVRALVDRLLASPHYGERWGGIGWTLRDTRTRMDMRRDNPRSIWPYRDWCDQGDQ
jgi:hypothetical protein